MHDTRQGGYFRRVVGVLTRRVNRYELLVLRSGSCEVVQLQGTSSDLWGQCSEKIHLSELARRLASSYRCPVQDIERDVEATVDRLVAAGVLEWVG